MTDVRQQRETDENLAECIARTRAESVKTESEQLRAAWDHAMRILLNVRSLVAAKRAEGIQ